MERLGCGRNSCGTFLPNKKPLEDFDERIDLQFMLETWLELECVSCGHVARLTGDNAWVALHKYNQVALQEGTDSVDINSRILIDGCNINGCIPTWLKDELETHD